jgi:hypothetical protein
MSTTTRRIKWTPEIRKELSTLVLTRPVGTLASDRFKAFKEDHRDLSTIAISWAFYDTIRNHPEVIREIISECAQKGIPVIDPFKEGRPYSEVEESDSDEPAVPEVNNEVEEVEVKAVVSDEEQLLGSVSKVIGGLSKLEGLNAAEFLNGFATILEKAAGVVDTELVREKESENAVLNQQISELNTKVSELEAANKNMVEVLEYVSTTIGWFATLSTQDKIMNISKITQNLRNTIFSIIKN